MTDSSPSWQSDPTGRHEHRYWDGSQWTEHVSDAGVAAVDPYVAPTDPTPPIVEEPAAGFEAPSPSASAEPEAQAASAAPSPPSEPDGPTTPTTPAATTTPASDDRPGWASASIASTPADAGADATVADAAPEAGPDAEPTPAATPDTAASTGYGTPTGYVAPPSYDEPLPSEIGISTGGRPAEASDAADAPGDADTAIVETTPSGSADAPTLVGGIGAVDAPADPTTAWPTAPAMGDAPPPPVFTPPADGGDGGSGGSKRGLLIGVGLLVIAAIVAAVALLGGGDKGDDLATRIASEIRQGGDSGLTKKEATCIANEVIDKVGADKLKNVDFTADQPPKAIADDLQKAMVDAIGTCHVNLSDTTDTTAGSTDGTTDSTAGGTPTPAELNNFKDMLAKQYEETLGLSKEKSECLANVMADAVQSGKLSEQDSFDEFFNYLDKCDISLSELGASGN